MAFIAASLAAAILLGALRATTVRLWIKDGRVVRQGTWLTVILWLISVGSHLVASALLHGAAATADRFATLLFFGVTLGAQQLVLLGRVRTGAPPRLPRARPPSVAGHPAEISQVSPGPGTSRASGRRSAARARPRRPARRPARCGYA